ncbi:MAG: glycosyltransferase family A protein [Verrucomicrobiota bacterium]
MTFSVVIPAHNSGAFLKEALESVRAQTFQDFEVIIVDDASIDDTWQVVQSCQHWFSGRCRSLRIEPPRNEGPAGARNLALGQAQGESVAFLDSDDLWVPEHLARAQKCFRAHGDKVGLFAGPGQIIGTKRLLHEFQWPDPEPQPASPQLLQQCYFPLPSVCVRRSLLDEVGGFCAELVCHEDWLLYLLLSKRTLFMHSPEVECLIRRRPESVTRSRKRMSKPMYRDWVKAYLTVERSQMWSNVELRTMREGFIQDRAGELADYLCAFDVGRAAWSTSGLVASGLRGQKVWRPILWLGFCEFLCRGLRKVGRSLRAK